MKIELERKRFAKSDYDDEDDKSLIDGEMREDSSKEGEQKESDQLKGNDDEGGSASKLKKVNFTNAYGGHGHQQAEHKKLFNAKGYATQEVDLMRKQTNNIVGDFLSSQ